MITKLLVGGAGGYFAGRYLGSQQFAKELSQLKASSLVKAPDNATMAYYNQRVSQQGVTASRWGLLGAGVGLGLMFLIGRK